MNTSLPQLRPRDFVVPGLLLLLSFIPMVGGLVRLRSLARDVVVTPENARFVASPAPILIHVFAVSVYCLLGAFQFSAGFRRRWPRLHRTAGRWLVACGLLSASSGVWMTVAYPIPETLQGPLTYWVRLIVGTLMFTSLVAGLASILRRDVARHEAFMIRAYALGQGAGTQAVILGPWMLITGQGGGPTRDALLTVSWVLNAVVAEWIIRRRKTRRGDVRALQPI